LHNLIKGCGLILFAALCNGAFAVPLRVRRRYGWENTWVLAHLFAMGILPLLLASILLPGWSRAIGSVGPGLLTTVLAFGFLWGLGSVTFAIGIDAVGIALGYAIIMGTITAVGSVIPVVRRWSTVGESARTAVFLGIGVCILGVAVCGYAGMMRERDAGKGPRTAGKMTFVSGLLWCVLCGVLSAGNNLGFDFAERIATEVQRLGGRPMFASLARWLVVYWGGYLAVLTVCGAKMIRTGSWRKYRGPGSVFDASMAIIMGVLHFTSQLTYGIGTDYIGPLGTSVGFAILLSGSLLIANFFGFLTGEWKTASPGSARVLYGGLAILVLAVLVLGYSNTLLPETGATRS
jgi:L-rhamnose-H+ transport protein